STRAIIRAIDTLFIATVLSERATQPEPAAAAASALFCVTTRALVCQPRFSTYASRPAKSSTASRVMTITAPRRRGLRRSNRPPGWGRSRFIRRRRGVLVDLGEHLLDLIGESYPPGDAQPAARRTPVRRRHVALGLGDQAVVLDVVAALLG